MTYAIRDDNGPITPQVAYVDGYSFGDRLLEGVMFEIAVLPNQEGLLELVCNRVDPSCRDYMSQFDTKKVAWWCERALECALEQMTDLSGRADYYWGEGDEDE
jgi:hypothetical protein